MSQNKVGFINSVNDELNFVSDYYLTPVQGDKTHTFLSPKNFIQRFGNLNAVYNNGFEIKESNSGTIVYRVEIYRDSGFITDKVYLKETINGQTTSVDVTDYPTIPIIEDKTIYIPLGTMELSYWGGFDGGTVTTWTGVIGYVENHLPLKKHTCLDVINRIFDTVTPLFDNEKPQFRLKGVIYDDETGNPIGYLRGNGLVTLTNTSQSALATALNVLNNKY